MDSKMYSFFERTKYIIMEDKKFKTESFMKVSDLTKFLNAKHLLKENIVGLLPMGEFVFLIYIE